MLIPSPHLASWGAFSPRKGRTPRPGLLRAEQRTAMGQGGTLAKAATSPPGLSLCHSSSSQHCTLQYHARAQVENRASQRSLAPFHGTLGASCISQMFPRGWGGQPWGPGIDRSGQPHRCQHAARPAERRFPFQSSKPSCLCPREGISLVVVPLKHLSSQASLPRGWLLAQQWPRGVQRLLIATLNFRVTYLKESDETIPFFNQFNHFEEKYCIKKTRTGILWVWKGSWRWCVRE